MKCLICEKEGIERENRCKLCNMGLGDNIKHFSGFSFCCNRCSDFFNRISVLEEFQKYLGDNRPIF
ncbi:MAG: hypothetical protein V1870_02320 [Candidatus Aenigmatarchaeota archaeon]